MHSQLANILVGISSSRDETADRKVKALGMLVPSMLSQCNLLDRLYVFRTFIDAARRNNAAFDFTQCDERVLVEFCAQCVKHLTTDEWRTTLDTLDPRWPQNLLPSLTRTFVVAGAESQRLLLRDLHRLDYLMDAIAYSPTRAIYISEAVATHTIENEFAKSRMVNQTRTFRNNDPRFSIDYTQ
jgi:hypothetical protein